MSDTADKLGTLKPAQHRRVLALAAARDTLGGRNVFGSNGVDASPVITVAHFILTGEHSTDS